MKVTSSRVKSSRPLISLRVSLGQDQALLAKDQVDPFDGNVRDQSPDIGDIVLSGFRVQQVGTGQMGDPPFEGHQSSGAAHIAGGQAETREIDWLKNSPAGPGYCRGCRR